MADADEQPQAGRMFARSERAERLGDFFALQLGFAEQMAVGTRIPLRLAVLKFTNFHRRFGFGDPDRTVSPFWEDYVRKLEALRDGKDRVAWTQAFFRNAPDETPPPDQRFFGCFGCEAPDQHGVVRIHFGNRDKDGIGPLHHSKIGRRKGDLAELTTFISQSYPGAARIVGLSWLYHLDAYRRLFPPDYGASSTPAPCVRLSGTSSWGQFLSHTEAIKPALRDAFLRNCDSLDLDAPWRSFPLPALIASAPLSVFQEFYKAGQSSSW